MSTFIINLNDPALCDSTIIELAKVVNTCQPCIQGTETNWQDVAIVYYICWTVFASVVVIAFTLGIIAWHNYRKAKECDDLETKKETLKNQLEEANNRKRELENEVEELKKKIKKNHESEKASVLLKEISSLSRPKDGIADDKIANELFTLYLKIKNDFKENHGE